MLLLVVVASINQSTSSTYTCHTVLSTTEPEQMVAGEDTEFLNHLLLKATYIVRKPLDQATMAQLWRVVAWRRCCLEERIPRDSMDDIAAHAGVVGKDGNDNDVIIIEEPQVHFKVVRSRGSRKRQLTINVDSGSSDGAGSSEHQKHCVILTPRAPEAKLGAIC